MANQRTDDVRANVQPGTKLPTVAELFGDVEALPLFRDIAVACERSVRERTLAWPLRFPLPPAPPQPPDFAGLAGMYCNHLAAVLGIHVRTSALREHAASARDATLQLAFLLLAAHVFGKHLPRDVAQQAYLDRVASLLLSGMRVTLPNEEEMWTGVGRDALKLVNDDCAHRNAESARCLDQLTILFLELPAAEREATDDALHATYQRGQRLFEMFCESIASRP